MLKEKNLDFIFVLDSDEFLCFRNRNDLEKFLNKVKDSYCFSIPWLNICPEFIDGRDIFSASFFHRGRISPFSKVVLTKRLLELEGWVVSQGNHSVMMDGRAMSKVEPSLIGNNVLYHIPIQSINQFRFKLAQGYRSVFGSKRMLKYKAGFHWIALSEKAKEKRLTNSLIKKIVLNYSEENYEIPNNEQILSFDFPYIKSSYSETIDEFISRIEGLLYEDRKLPLYVDPSDNYIIFDQNMNIFARSESPFRNPRRLVKTALLNIFPALSEPRKHS